MTCLGISIWIMDLRKEKGMVNWMIVMMDDQLIHSTYCSWYIWTVGMAFHRLVGTSRRLNRTCIVPSHWFVWYLRLSEKEERNIKCVVSQGHFTYCARYKVWSIVRSLTCYHLNYQIAKKQDLKSTFHISNRLLTVSHGTKINSTRTINPKEWQILCNQHPLSSI